MPGFLTTIFIKIKTIFYNMFKGAKLSLLSLKAYYSYKKLLLIPFLCALLCAFLLTLMLTIIISFHVEIDSLSKAGEYVVYGSAWGLLVLLVSLVNVFFNVATAYTVASYFDTGAASLWNAIQKTFKKWKAILFWGGAEAIVRMISSKDDKEESSFASFAVHTSWNLFTFFIAPLIAFEDLTFISGFKESIKKMKSDFATVSGSIFSFSVLTKLVLPIMLVIGYIHIFILDIAQKLSSENVAAAASQSSDADSRLFILLVAVPYMATIFLFFVQLVLKAKVIASTALYRHSKGQSTGIFSDSMIENILHEKKS